MKIIAASIVFLIGIAFLCTYKSSDLREGFSIENDCPNLLVQKGKELHLIYSGKAKIPGVNPVKFNNLEDYTEFLRWQRAKGIRCPVLYFQQTYDAQNNVGYRMLPDPVEKQAGLSSFPPRKAVEKPLYDANHDDMPYNKSDYPGFDAQDQYIGSYTPLDKNFKSSERVSANAMDTNWGGASYSDELADAGVFAEDTRKSYDNPFVSRQRNIAFQDEMPRSTNIRHHKGAEKGSRQSPETIAAIKRAYGGRIENTPEERALH
jgi:hypothetical protein